MSLRFLACWLASGWCLAVAAGADTLGTCRERLSEIPAEFVSADLENPAESLWEATRLQQACPQLAEELATEPWASLLARVPQKRGLADLDGLAQLERYYSLTPPLAKTDSAALERALASLEIETPLELSLWDQFWRWLVEHLQGNDLQITNWFEDFSVSASALEWTLYGSVALMLIVAVFIVGNELRHGLRGRRRVAPGGWSLPELATEQRLSFRDLAAAKLVDQPGLLLRIVIRSLQTAGRIEYRVSMTHQDLKAAAMDMERGAALASISTAAERCAFGGWRPGQEEVDALIASGQALLRDTGVEPS